jgi:hypothetical protein
MTNLIDSPIGWLLDKRIAIERLSSVSTEHLQEHIIINGKMTVHSYPPCHAISKMKMTLNYR